MTYDSQRHRRRSIRLKGYDYSQAGAYFITVVVHDRVCLFGDVAEGQMHLNDVGRMVLEEWHALADRFPSVALGVFGVMPNHIHGILVIGGTDVGNSVARSGATTRVAPTSAAAGLPALGDMVGAFKSLTTDLYIRGVKHCGWPPFRGRLWQRNYHEHIIRNEESLNLIRQYILDNPACWDSDEENPQVERQSRKTL